MISAAVLDASVGIKLFIEEEGSAQADRLLGQLSASPPARFYVPDLFFIECANILWKYVRFFGYPADNARQDVRDLGALALRAVSTADLIAPALELALAWDLSAYDACYAALAQQANLPLVTADERLGRRLAESGIDVQLLLSIQ
ncbi:MAG TPA: type II toxin-antitoxin system VapC family toxin [Anaerolineales bacterium]|nr:type II toxin-antitoxin system VapC family toxin [Anaerolineales bacterium]